MDAVSWFEQVAGSEGAVLHAPDIFCLVYSFLSFCQHNIIPQYLQTTDTAPQLYMLNITLPLSGLSIVLEFYDYGYMYSIRPTLVRIGFKELN